MLLSYRLFQRLGEASGHIEPALLGDLHEAGRAGYVHLGQVIPDDVEPDHQQAFRGEPRTDALSNLAVAPRERPCHALASDGEVAARFARLRDARESVRYGFARDQDDALVTFR